MIVYENGFPFVKIPFGESKGSFYPIVQSLTELMDSVREFLPSQNTEILLEELSKEFLKSEKKDAYSFFTSMAMLFNHNILPFLDNIDQEFFNNLNKDHFFGFIENKSNSSNLHLWVVKDDICKIASQYYSKKSKVYKELQNFECDEQIFFSLLEPYIFSVESIFGAKRVGRKQSHNKIYKVGDISIKENISIERDDEDSDIDFMPVKKITPIVEFPKIDELKLIKYDKQTKIETYIDVDGDLVTDHVEFLQNFENKNLAILYGFYKYKKFKKYIESNGNPERLQFKSDNELPVFWDFPMDIEIDAEMKFWMMTNET
jgi:hypothetical protein